MVDIESDHCLELSDFFDISWIDTYGYEVEVDDVYLDINIYTLAFGLTLIYRLLRAPRIYDAGK